MPDEKTILLTGATGLLGREILQSILTSNSNTRVLVLIRGESSTAQTKFDALIDEPLRAEFARRVEPIWGDLQLPNLGLAPAARKDLTERITHVIHSAAAIDFSMDYPFAHTINHDGTVRIYELASEARNLNAFAHVSTAYVAGRRTGTITEDELEHNAGFINNYDRTKYESEQFLRAHMSDLPIAVYRTMTMIGDAKTGIVRQFNYFHDSMRSLYLGRVPVIPGDPDYCADVVPVDWAANVIRFLALENFHPGETYHLCSGTEHSYTLQELFETTVAVFAASPHSKRRKIRVPAIISETEFEALLAQGRPDKRSEKIEQLLKPFSYFIAHLVLPKVFEASHLQRDLQGQAMDVPDIRSYYAKVLEFCLATQWGKRDNVSDRN